MGYTDHLEGSLAEKEEQIKLLEGQSIAYSTRIFVLQSRLLKALDTLDTMQITHSEEISALEENVSHLKAQLDRYRQVVKDADDDRNDMRDAVMRLVEKVAISNDDFSSWPHSRIHLTRFEDPTEDSDPKRLNTTSEQDLLSYAASINEAICKERDNERRSHAHTRATLQARVVALEAQLSRREAELATCAVHVHRDSDFVAHLSPKEGEESRQDTVDSDQIMSALDVTVARNKVMELEIKSLAKRLESARANQASASGTEDEPTERKTSQAMESRADSNRNYRVQQGQQHVPDIDNLDVAPQFALQELERDIRRLGEKVEDFVQERNNILRSIPSVPSNPSTSRSDEKVDLQNRIHALEIECDRLQKAENSLMEDLERTRAEARTREAELLEEIATLKLDQDDTERVPVAPLLELDGSDGEISMELATPLMPTSVMPPSPTPVQDISVATPRTPASSASSPPDVQRAISNEGLSIPLPPSPRTTSDESDMPSPISEISSHDRSPVSLPPQLVAEIATREEAQLIERQRQIEVGETALSELVELIHELNS